MKSICIIIIVLVCSLQSFSQQIVFDTRVSCGSDSSFLTSSSPGFHGTTDIHEDKRGNYHVVGFWGYMYNATRMPKLNYRKFSKQKLPLYQRIYANTPVFNAGDAEYLNSVTTDDTLNYYYTGQYLGKGQFRFNSLYYNTSGSNIYDFAFIAKHDSLNNLKFLLLYTPNYSSGQYNGMCSFTDIVHLNGKLYTFFTCAIPGTIKKCNIQNNTWTDIHTGVTPGMYLMEFKTDGTFLSKTLVTQAYNTAPNIFYFGGGAYTYYNATGGKLSIDKQNRILINYLNQYGGPTTIPITYGLYPLHSGHYSKTYNPYGVSSLAVYDTQNGWLSGRVVEEGNLTNINGAINHIDSDIHGNKYVLSNNNTSTSSSLYYNLTCVLGNDTIKSLGTTISKYDVYENALWNKYFFNCLIVDMKLSKDGKHIGLIVNPHAQYTPYSPYTNIFSFGSSATNVDTVITAGHNSIFIQLSNNGVLEKIYQFNELTYGQFLNIDDDGYFNLNGIKVPQAPQYNLYATSLKIDGNIGQCSGPAFPGGLNDTLFIHLPKRELCSNTSLYIPWIATPSITSVNLGYYINASSTKNYIASNLSAQTYGYQWNMPNTIPGADSIKLFIESSNLLFSHQIGFYKFHSNKNILVSRDTTICKNIPLGLTPLNPANLTWSPTSYFANPFLDSTQVVSINNTTQLFVSETYTNSVCFSYDTINIHVFQDPVAAFSHSLLPTSLSLVNNSVNADTVKWFVNNVFTTSNINNLTTGFISPSMTVCLLASKCITDTVCHSINVYYAMKDTLEICALDSAFLQGNWQYTPGVYTDTLTAKYGVDSVIKTTLIVRPIKTLHTIFSLCSNDSIFFHGQYQTNNIVFSDTLQTSYGCDSIVKTTINFKPTYFTITNRFICPYDSAFLEGHYTQTPGFYKDTLQTIYGCDSIVHTQLNINSIDISTSLNGISIMANAVNATYQWINCSNNTLMVNEINQSFNPTMNGNYACIVTQYNCIDTTSCISIQSVGLNTINKGNDIMYYPNPTTGVFTIEIDNDAIIDIYNVLSELIISQKLEKRANKIDLTTLPDGIYSIKIKLDNQTKNAIIIKKQ